jgi:rhodanese-related sulfurtransferase
VCSEHADTARITAPRRRSAVKQTLLRAVLIVSVGALAGLGVNYARLASGELTNGVERAPDAGHAHEVITVQQANDHLRKGDVIFVDARPKSQFEGAHIPGAINIPIKHLDETFTALGEWFPADIPVVVYGHTGHMPKLESALKAAGCKHVELLQEGFKGWQSARMPIATGAEPRWE